MHILLTQEQFNALKQKTKSNGKESKLLRLELKESDDEHGILDTDDVTMDYFYNAAEGRLYLSVSKRKSLASYCAGDAICCTYVIDLLSTIPKPATTDKRSGTGDTGVNSGEGETPEKKAPEQYQPSQ